MANDVAKAFPRKRFFLQMFTRDIRLDDCILDLIDNSVDSVIRTEDIDVRDTVLSKPSSHSHLGTLPKVEVKFSASEFSIDDNCGGISVSDAKEDVFNFGHDLDHDSATTGRRLGAYGVGMKRAIFKIGQHFEITSKTTSSGFKMNIDVKEWAQKDESPDDWVFPIQVTKGVNSSSNAGTKIRVTDFSNEMKGAFQDELLETRLKKQVATTYALFLGKVVDVYINGERVDPIDIPLGESGDVTPAIEVIKIENVEATIIASFAARVDGKWRQEVAGWYLLCNGRVIVAHDKGEATGWGAGTLPNFQPSHRGFVGIVSFVSDDPLELPWQTTKRGLNHDSPAYQRIKKRMGVVARPIIRQLEMFYSKGSEDLADEKRVAEGMTQSKFHEISKKSASPFGVKGKAATKPRETEQVNFTAKRSELDAVKRHLRDPRMSKSKIGEHVLEYFLKSEGLK